MLAEKPRNLFPAIAVERFRISTDGAGITTLAAAYGCPLKCRYCLNPHSQRPGTKVREYTPMELYEEVKRDHLYFVATGGGITFGGGEPLLYSDFIVRFRETVPVQWRINIETSLCVPEKYVLAAVKAVDMWIVDIKDMNDEIYRNYTGRSAAFMKENLKFLKRELGGKNVYIRVPAISGYNTPEDQQNSVRILREMGFLNLEIFDYVRRDEYE